MKAAGAYLRVFREHEGYTQDDVARRLGVSGRQVIRWEQGDSQPSAAALAQIVEMVGAPAEHVLRLLRNPDLVEADGIALARQYLASADQTEIQQFVNGIADEDLGELIEVSQRLRTDRGLLAKWLGFGRGLSER